jgi:hypothetical protein
MLPYVKVEPISAVKNKVANAEVPAAEQPLPKYDEKGKKN